MKESQKQQNRSKPVSFKRGCFNLRVELEFPFDNVQGIETLSMKTDLAIQHENRIKTRRRSSVLKSIQAMVTNMRAVSYVLAIVAIYALTWTPFFVYCFYKTLIRTKYA